MAEPVPKVGEWLERVLNGHYQYFGVPGNWASLGLFRERIARYWGRFLRRAHKRGKSLPSGWVVFSHAGCLVPGWCTLTGSRALPLPIQGKSRMRQSRLYGSVRACVKNAFFGARCCARDEGGPFGAGVQAQAPNSRKLLSSH